MQPEDHRTEYKLKLTEQLEKEVVGFLNSREGGLIYIGVADDGHIVGVEDIDATQRKVIDRIKSNIVPPVMGLFEVMTENMDGGQILQITVLSGPEKPYYIRAKGMSPEGSYIRIGSSTQPMTHEMIESIYSKRTRTTLKNTPSPHQDLTFAQLKIYYEENGLPLTEQFAKNLDLLTNEGRYNYFAFLLADKNSISIKIAKYRGQDKSDLIENKEFGYCSLIKSTFNVLNRFDIENVPLTNITSSIREETYPVDPVSIREAIVNSIVHNDFGREVPPVFEIYSDKIVITSAGGLPSDMTEEEFYQGFSVPRNRELMRIFKDVHLVEHIGSGIPRILKKYERSIFNFTTNFLRVVFKFPESIIERNETPDKGHLAGVESEVIIDSRVPIEPDKVPIEPDIVPIEPDKVPIEPRKVPIDADGVPIENKQYLKIFEYLFSNDCITNAIVVKLLEVKPTRAKIILRDMVEQNLLEAKGEKRYRKYILKAQHSNSVE